MEIKRIELCSGAYASKWGLTDFYPEAERALSEAIASGESFTTSYGCKKELLYCTLTRDMEGDDFWIEVTAEMDDLWESADLIYDAMNEEVELPDDIIDSIRDAAIDDGIDDHTTLSMLLSAAASYSDVVEAIETLENEAEEANHNMFLRLTDIVEAHIQYMRKEGIE